MPIVGLKGKQISYWTGREGLSGGREPVLFIHGAGGGQYTWGYQKAYFERRFRPLIIELPGHGASGGEGEEEVGRYADHVRSLLEALHLQKVFFVGHSMGGAIVQIMALKYPEVIKGIVLAGTGARLKVLPLILDGIKAHFEETVRKINELSFSGKAAPWLIERSAMSLTRCRPEVLYGDYLACDRFDLMDEVEKIDLPTLILCGDEDRMTPVKYSQYLHSRIRESKLEILTDAGHMLMMEAADAFNEKIGQFVVDVSKKV
jgi:pimeloyl-ACP methyl ester carboxylesterase